MSSIAVGDSVNIRGLRLRNANARTVPSRQEMLNSNVGHEEQFGDFQLQITLLFMVGNIKCGCSFD